MQMPNPYFERPIPCCRHLTHSVQQRFCRNCGKDIRGGNCHLCKKCSEDLGRCGHCTGKIVHRDNPRPYLYSEEKRNEAIRLCQETDLTYSEIGRITGIHRQMVRIWCLEAMKSKCRSCQLGKIAKQSRERLCQGCLDLRAEAEELLLEETTIQQTNHRIQQLETLIQPHSGWPPDEILLQIDAIPGGASYLAKKLLVSRQRISQKVKVARGRIQSHN